MRRLVWVGVGVVVTVVVIQRGRKIVAQYAPASVVDRAERAVSDAGRRGEAAWSAFRTEFRDARARREAELTAALLAQGQPDPEDVRASGLRPADLRGGPPSRPRHAAGVDPEAETDADEAELGYSF